METNERILKLTQKLSDAISSSRQYISKPKPLNACIAHSVDNMKYPLITNLFEFFRKGFLSDLEVKIAIHYNKGIRTFVVSRKSYGILNDTSEEMEFESYNEALNQFNKWRK